MCLPQKNSSFYKFPDYSRGFFYDFVDLQMSVTLGHINGRVSHKLLDIFERNAMSDENCCRAVPLWYNWDKSDKPDE
jgi:hypothetical protein